MNKFVTPSRFSCQSVAGGWQTYDRDADSFFGPTYHDVRELWAWQKDNIENEGPSFNRKYAIDILVEYDMEYSMDYADSVDAMLRYGHRGYNDYTDDELLEVLRYRDLLETEETA